MTADRTAGGAASEVVKAVLDVTPTDRYGKVLVRSYELTDPEEWGDPAPIAARQAAAAFRAVADEVGNCACNDPRQHLLDLADEIDGGTDATR